jgi:sugar lactone lactonase YvrE
VPDGMALAADGRLFVATTVSQGVTIISPDGAMLGEIHLGEHAANRIFDGPDLYVTATREADIEARGRHRARPTSKDARGRHRSLAANRDIMAAETVTTGLELIPGQL